MGLAYRAVNGVLPPVLLTEGEAREFWDLAGPGQREGEFGGRFVTWATGEHGARLAPTWFVPLDEDGEQ